MRILVFILVIFNLISCNGQSQSEKSTVSDDFDNSPPIFYGLPDNITSIDTSPGWNLDGHKLLLTGTIYEQDGKTPAPNVLMYYYHTDLDGKYLHKENEKRSVPPNKLGQTHGYIRGWVKSDKSGKYEIYTIRPGVYPNRKEAAHIHVHIKEPDTREPYYIDNFVFDDDILLTAQMRKRLDNRGGSGVLRIVDDEGLQIGERDIILGLNVPNYPSKKK